MRHLSILVGSLALLAGCADAPSGLHDPSALRLDRQAVTLAVGDTVRLHPSSSRTRLAPVDWSVDDAAVVLVEDGLLIPVAPGRTHVRATTVDVEGAAAATASVSVGSSTVRVVGLDIIPDRPTIEPKAALQLAAKLTYSHGFSLTVRSSPTWRTLAPSVATIQAGKVVGVAAGTARIVVSVMGFADTTVVTVAAPKAPEPKPEPKPEPEPEPKPEPAPEPAPSQPGSIKAHYVAPNGTSAGDGTSARPWNLATALAHPARVKAGDTIYVRGGSYRGLFKSTLAGTASDRIIVRAYRGERVVLNGNGATGDVLTVSGPYSTFWGLEITDSLRTPTARRSSGVTVHGSHTRLVNLVVHDLGGEGIGFWSSATGGEVYGSLVYNNGYEDASRSHGHGIYTQNRSGTKYITDNVIFNQFGWGIHMYGTSAAALRSYAIEGNTVFDNGALSSVKGHENLLIGGGTPAGDIEVARNVFYRSPGPSALNLLLGYSPGTVNDDLTLQDNLVLGGSMAMSLGNWQSVRIARNTFSAGAVMSVGVPVAGVGSYTWSGNTHLADATRRSWRYGTTTYTWSDFLKKFSAASADAVKSTSSTPTVVVRPNKYEDGRATVTVVNPSGAGGVAVNLSGVLRAGDRYVVRDARDLFGTPLATGTFGGSTINVTLANRAQPRAIGGSPSAAPAMTPHFAVLVVTRE